MPPSPLICAPEDKARIEAANGVEQVDFISYLVNELRIQELRESYVLEFHRLAVQNIYPCAGKYRDARHQVTIEGSDHTIPHESLVQSHVRDLIDRLNQERLTRPALERAAYALWRLNWIHPFAGGNGRTSRALSYLILCVDMGMMLPGTPSVPTLIYENRADYVKALRVADKGARERGDGAPDLSAMAAFVQDVVTRQLAAAVKKLKDPPP